MFQIGQNLALVAEPAEDGCRVHAALDQLDGDLLVKLPVRAFGQVHRAHAAAPDLSNNPIRADHGAGRGGF
jgi:hypothetical protein